MGSDSAQCAARNASPDTSQLDVGELLEAARVAANVDAVSATRLLERALECLDPGSRERSGALILLAETSAAAGMAQLAESAAREVHERSHDGADTTVLLAHALHIQGRHDEELALLDEYLEGIASDQGRARAQRALAHAEAMNLSEAVHDAECVLSDTRSDELARVVALLALGLVRHFEGRIDEAIDSIQSAADIVEGSSDIEAVRRNPRLLLGAVLAFGNRHLEAQSTLREALAASQRLGCLADTTLGYWYWGFSEFRAGRWAEALDRLAEADNAGLGPQRDSALLNGLSALILARRGQFVDASLWIHRGRGMNASFVAEAWFVWAESLMLEAQTQQGAALDGLLKLWNEAEEKGSRAAVFGIVPDLMRLARIDPAVRDSVASEVAQIFERSRNTSLEPHCKLASGVSASSSADLARAHEGYASIPLPLYAGLAKEEEAVELAAKGSMVAAKSALVEALNQYEGLGSWTDERRARARLRSFKVVSRRTPPGRRAGSGWESLTPTEREVAGFIAAGLRNQEIAALMFVSIQTIETHLKRLFKKLGVTSRLQLGLQASTHIDSSTPEPAKDSGTV